MKSRYSLSSEEFDDLVKIASKMYKSSIDLDIFISLLNIIYDKLEQHNRIFVIRADLRFAQSHVAEEPDLPLCFH